ncbi:hypothetical protein [Sphingobacterium sp. IITKGP-BTPF85]|uniref:hypothetical protein n=1 Tax=Sphingobacterium sp. IITKGP-BTPF85 TaxID=1338009 RepID=UPI00038A0305|nr:hypothetical protein [Sphingobacterium sp. IITKGP-BTPF85]KKX48354.1 hypothetical protein L950_0221620 [Sphingobacterium sp. IITKGP-BTPF85]
MEEILKEKQRVFKEIEKYIGKEKYNFIDLVTEIKDVVDNKDVEGLDIKKLKEYFKIISRNEENIDLAIDVYMLIEKLKGLKK